jgi:hypothetical protein
VIDSDFDPILSALHDLEQADSISKEAGVEAAYGSDNAIKGVVVKRLLSLLSSSTFSMAPCCMFLLAATNLSLSDISHSVVRPPGFEKTLEIPRLSRTNRVSMIKSKLRSCGLRLASPPPAFYDKTEVISDVNVNDRDNDNYSDESIIVGGAHHQENLLSEWATRIAALTGGYAPEDIVRLIDYACTSVSSENLSLPTELIRDDHADDIAQDKTCGPIGQRQEAAEPLQWSHVLSSITACPPKQLHDIGMLSASLNKESERLSWDHFGGYEDLKLQLRQLLGRTNKEISVKTIVEDDSVRANALPRHLRMEFPRGIVLHGPSGIFPSSHQHRYI